MAPTSSSVLSFPGYKFVPFGKYNSRFVIAVSLVVLLFLGTWMWLSWSGGSKEIYLRAAGCSRQRDIKSFKLKTKDSSHSGACILAPEKLTVSGTAVTWSRLFFCILIGGQCVCVFITGFHNWMKFDQSSLHLQMHFSKATLLPWCSRF